MGLACKIRVLHTHNDGTENRDSHKFVRIGNYSSDLCFLFCCRVFYSPGFKQSITTFTFTFTLRGRPNWKCLLAVLFAVLFYGLKEEKNSSDILNL